jgi:hypothetical protein
LTSDRAKINYNLEQKKYTIRVSIILVLCGGKRKGSCSKNSSVVVGRLKLTDLAGLEVQSVCLSGFDEIHQRIGEPGTTAHGGIWLLRVAGQAEQRGRLCSKRSVIN